jgi:DNA-binding SARP family transcriptional activator
VATAVIAARPAVQLGVLGCFDLRCGGRSISLPSGAQRLVAFLVLHNRPVLRTYVAASLWPDVPEQRAFGNLRSVLWRLRHSGTALVQATSTHLRLTPGIEVDFHDAAIQMRRLLSERGLEGADVELIEHARELLPEHSDDWVLPERERFRQLRAHALECLCELLTEIGSFGEAVDAGLMAIEAEPLRESAHRALVRAYLAEGNAWQALRQFQSYRGLLRDEPGLEPSAAMRELVQRAEAVTEGRRAAYDGGRAR